MHSAETVEFRYGFKLLRLALRFRILSCRYRVNAAPKRTNFVPFLNSAGIVWTGSRMQSPGLITSYAAGHRGNGLKYTVWAGSPRSASTIGLRLSITKFLRHPTKFEPCWRRALPATYMRAFGALRSSFVNMPGVSTIPEERSLF